MDGWLQRRREQFVQTRRLSPGGIETALLRQGKRYRRWIVEMQVACSDQTGAPDEVSTCPGTEVPMQGVSAKLGSYSS